MVFRRASAYTQLRRGWSVEEREPKPIKKVLIVDDERDLVELLSLRLSKERRFEVFTAFDVEEGWRKALAVRPDAVLVDLVMPDGGGRQLCRRLRENARTREASLVIMTAWMPMDIKIDAPMEGATQILLKPFEDEELLAALDKEIET